MSHLANPLRRLSFGRSMEFGVNLTAAVDGNLTAGGGPDRCPDKVGPMNSEQLQSLAVLALAMVPVALLWRVWIRMLD